MDGKMREFGRDESAWSMYAQRYETVSSPPTFLAIVRVPPPIARKQGEEGASHELTTRTGESEEMIRIRSGWVVGTEVA